jgi:glycosyltransferase involved in cell wall biosynthesis
MKNIAQPLPVLMDVGPAVHQRAGLSRYTERLASSLLATESAESAEPADLQLNLFYNAHSGHRLPPSLAAAPNLRAVRGQYAWRMGALASQLARHPYAPVDAALRTLAAGGRTPLYHATEHLLPCVAWPAVLTVHDLIFERYPEHHTRRNMLFLRTAMPRFVRAANAIIAVSAHTRRDIIEFYGADRSQIHVIHEGIDATFAPSSAAEVARVRTVYSPDRPWLLMVGTLEPRKNHAAALHALRRLRTEGFPHRLLIAGGQGWLFAPIRRLVEALGLVDDVVFTGYVPDADLPPLYSGASALLMPSLYEGFGFPLLEAMACGAPVVAANVSSLPELAGDAALLVPPTDDDALTHAVRLLLTQPDLAAALRTRGMAQARRFTWARCAAETAALYQETAAQWAARQRAAGGGA